MKPFKKSFTKNEGELKKLMNNITPTFEFTEIAKDVSVPCKAMGLQNPLIEKYIPLSKTKEILDEAKKEFPFFNPVEGIFNVEKSLEIYQKFTTEVLTWLNKWFGTPEKETI